MSKKCGFFPTAEIERDKVASQLFGAEEAEAAEHANAFLPRSAASL